MQSKNRISGFSFIIFFIFLFKINGFAQPTGAIKDAFDYLNAIRKNPGAYSSEISTAATKVDLSTVDPIGALTWNDTLAKVAQAKAQDMVKRGYDGHLDPDGNGINILIAFAGYDIPFPEYADVNYYESLASGSSSPKVAIQHLINDAEPNHQRAGHRKHLLGIQDSNKYLVDIGIGWVTGGKWGTYCVIIIAKVKGK